MATTEDQIDAMRSMCSTLEANDLLDYAYVDDWGRFGNFQIMVKPKKHDRHSTRKIASLVKKSLPKGAMLREIFGPDPIREYDSWTRKTVIVGYSRKFWVVDIDYQEYKPESNTFGGAFLQSQKVETVASFGPQP